MNDKPMRIWPPPMPQRPPADRGEPNAEPQSLRHRIIDALREVYDPEIPINIYDLGLIYGLTLDEDAGRVDITMTLTTPNCPEAESLPRHIREQVEAVDGVTHAQVRLVWDPPWTRERMSEDARLILGLD